MDFVVFQRGFDCFAVHQHGFGDFVFVIAQGAAQTYALGLVEVHFFVAETDCGIESVQQFYTVGGVRRFLGQFAQRAFGGIFAGHVQLARRQFQYGLAHRVTPLAHQHDFAVFRFRQYAGRSGMADNDTVAFVAVGQSDGIAADADEAAFINRFAADFGFF